MAGKTLKTMSGATPAPRKRPAAAEPSSGHDAKTKRSSATASACVCSAWSGGGTTLAALRAEIAKSTGADYRDKITVASLSAEVSSVLGVDFPNLSFIAAVVGAKDQAVAQLVSQGGAKLVYVVGESICLRHGCRCSLRDSGTIDVLVADGVEDMDQLVALLRFPPALAVECDLSLLIGRVSGGKGRGAKWGRSIARGWEPYELRSRP